MKSCVEYTYHRCVWHQFLTSRNTEKVRRIVERSQIDTFFKGFNYKIIYQYRMSKFLSGVNYTVSYCAYLAHIFNDAVIFILYRHKNV